MTGTPVEWAESAGMIRLQRLAFTLALFQSLGGGGWNGKDF